jgi:hypothetical protein
VNPFQSLRDYEEFVYTLRQQFPIIRQTTLVLIQRGRRIAILQGDILFDHGYRLSIKERLSDEAGHMWIEAYGYEIWRDSEKIAWYDAQPHPNVPELQFNFPHHKHVPPDIKHHRVPAPNMSFERPNLPQLIEEIDVLLKRVVGEGHQ